MIRRRLQGAGVPRRPGAAARAGRRARTRRRSPSVARRDAGDRHRRQPAAGGLRRQDARRHRRRRARGRRRAPTAPPSSWRSTPTTSTRSRPTSPRGCCPRRCSASASSPSSCPTNPSGERLADGDVIGAGPQRERHRAAAGHRRHCCRCCRRSQPQDLTYTLGAVADALRGRGDALGAEPGRDRRPTSGRSTPSCPSCRPTSRSSPTSPTPTTRAADDLLAVLDNLSITNTTMVDQPEQLRRTFTVVDASSNVTAGFLETNEQNLISLAQTSRPVLGRVRQVLARVPVPAQRPGPVQPDDQRGLRRRRRPGAEPEHHRQPAAAQPLRAR